MKDIVDKVRKALSDDLAANEIGELVEWNQDNPGSSLSALAETQGFPIVGWGMKSDDQELAQALISTGIGTIVIDLDQAPFFETRHQSLRIESETERAIAEADAEYALELMWPDKARDVIGLLDRLGMEIVPSISNYGGPGHLTYSRNEIRSL